MKTLSKKHKKIIPVLVLTFVLSIPLTAFAASHNFVYQFKYKLTSSTYSMSGSNITISTAHQNHWGGSPVGNAFTISLYRDNAWPASDDFIGSALYFRYLNDSNTWTNVGSGNYYFIMQKADDGEYIQGNGTIAN